MEGGMCDNRERSVTVTKSCLILRWTERWWIFTKSTVNALILWSNYRSLYYLLQIGSQCNRSILVFIWQHRAWCPRSSCSILVGRVSWYNSFSTLPHCCCSCPSKRTHRYVVEHVQSRRGKSQTDPLSFSARRGTYRYWLNRPSPKIGYNVRVLKYLYVDINDVCM